MPGAPAAVACSMKRCPPRSFTVFKAFTLQLWIHILPSAWTSASSGRPGAAVGSWGLLVARWQEDGCRWCPQGWVLCFPEPPKHLLWLCSFLGGLLGGLALSGTLKEDFPQTLLSSERLPSRHHPSPVGCQSLNAFSVSWGNLFSCLSCSALSQPVRVFFLPTAV